MDIDKLDLLHRVMITAGPKVDREIVKNLLMAITIFADRETGEELKRILRQMS